MWLVIGDSHVLGLRDHLGPEFHCEAFPGNTSGQVLQHLSRLLGALKTQAHWDGAVILAGANDTHLRPYETIENLLKIRRECTPLTATVWIAGYPDLDDATGTWRRRFAPYYIPPPPPDFGEDATHLLPAASALWAQKIGETVLPK